MRVSAQLGTARQGPAVSGWQGVSKQGRPSVSQLAWPKGAQALGTLWELTRAGQHSGQAGCAKWASGGGWLLRRRSSAGAPQERHQSQGSATPCPALQPPALAHASLPLPPYQRAAISLRKFDAVGQPGGLQLAQGGEEVSQLAGGLPLEGSCRQPCRAGREAEVCYAGSTVSHDRVRHAFNELGLATPHRAGRERGTGQTASQQVQRETLIAQGA